MNKIDSTNISQAIERFLAGETSLDEEAAIYRFYDTHRSGLPESIERLRGMFSWYESGLDSVHDPVEMKVVKPVFADFLRRFSGWISIAASIMLVATVGFVIAGRTTPVVEETGYVIMNGKRITDPAIANAETQRLQALFRDAEARFESMNKMEIVAPAIEDKLDMSNPTVRDIVNRFNNL